MWPLRAHIPPAYSPLSCGPAHNVRQDIMAVNSIQLEEVFQLVVVNHNFSGPTFTIFLVSYIAMVIWLVILYKPTELGELKPRHDWNTLSETRHNQDEGHGKRGVIIVKSSPNGDWSIMEKAWLQRSHTDKVEAVKLDMAERRMKRWRIWRKC